MTKRSRNQFAIADRFLSTSEVAAVLSISTDTVRRMIAEGVIRGVKIGAGRNRQVYRVRESEIARLAGGGDDTQAPSLVDKATTKTGGRLERFLK